MATKRKPPLSVRLEEGLQIFLLKDAKKQNRSLNNLISTVLGNYRISQQKSNSTKSK